jgi:hypothetical protein
MIGPQPLWRLGGLPPLQTEHRQIGVTPDSPVAAQGMRLNSFHHGSWSLQMLLYIPSSGEACLQCQLVRPCGVQWCQFSFSFASQSPGWSCHSWFNAASWSTKVNRATSRVCRALPSSPSGVAGCDHMVDCRLCHLAYQPNTREAGVSCHSVSAAV